jgi:hypothetical protein
MDKLYLVAAPKSPGLGDNLLRKLSSEFCGGKAQRGNGMMPVTAKLHAKTPKLPGRKAPRDGSLPGLRQWPFCRPLSHYSCGLQRGIFTPASFETQRKTCLPQAKFFVKRYSSGGGSGGSHGVDFGIDTVHHCGQRDSGEFCLTKKRVGSTVRKV